MREEGEEYEGRFEAVLLLSPERARTREKMSKNVWKKEQGS